MSALRKNVASQVLTFNAVNATTGAALTGATITTKVALDGTQSAGAGTVTELGTGQYKYVPTQGETNGTTAGFSFTATNMVPVNLHCFITAGDPTDAVRAGLTALPSVASGSAGAIPTTGTGANQISVSSGQVILQTGTGTGQLDFTSGVVKANATQLLGGTIPAPNVTGVPLVDLKYTLGTISPATAGSVRADAVTGAVGSVTGAVGSVTGAVGSVTGNVGGNVVGSVASVTARVTANTDQINADATSAANLAKTTRAVGRGTVAAAASTTSIPTSAFVPSGGAADQFKGRIITFDADTTTAALRGQSTDITASTNAATPTLTVTALTTAPASGDTFSVT